jgi:S-DNA-T family DNA segregation ATPase FtsK/SpoIIIE
MLERRGVISGYEGSKPRQVLVSEAELPRMLERLAGGSEAGPDDADADGDSGDAAELEQLSG